MDDGIKILTNIFNKLKNGNYHRIGRLLLYTQSIRGREIERNQETTDEFRFYWYVAEYFRESSR
jgi:hypothetical protein